MTRRMAARTSRRTAQSASDGAASAVSSRTQRGIARLFSLLFMTKLLEIIKFVTGVKRVVYVRTFGGSGTRNREPGTGNRDDGGWGSAGVAPIPGSLLVSEYGTQFFGHALGQFRAAVECRGGVLE